MYETLAIVLTSNVALFMGAYYLLKYKPELYTQIGLVKPQIENAPLPISLEPAPITVKTTKICGWCDMTISRKARRCPYCTTNLSAQSD